MKKNKIPSEKIILSNIIYANSNNNSEGIKCPFCGSSNVKKDDVHLTSFKIGGNDIHRVMYVCQDCESAFSVPIFDKTTGSINPDSMGNVDSEDNYDPSKNSVDMTDFFNQLNKISKNQAGPKFENLQTFVKGIDTLLCLVIFEDGTVHYITANTTLRNIKKKLEDGLNIDAVVKFTKTGVIFIRDLLNLRDVENIRFSQLAQLIRDGILHPGKKDTKDTKRKK